MSDLHIKPWKEPEPGKQTLATRLMERLRQEILSGDLLPGQRLRLEELRDRYGVSLSPLREAIARLGSQGLLQTEDQRGVRVAPVSAENLSEVVLLRSTLEPMALRDSIERGDDNWEASVTTALVMLSRQEKNTVQGAMRVERWERLHRQFHASLLSACQMPLLLQYCDMLHDRADRYRRLFLSNQPVDQSVMDEHKQIADASLNRDADSACALLKKHIERAAENVFDALKLQN